MARGADLLEGEKAPRFELTGPDGESVSLGDFLGSGPVVLFFTPTPDRGVCLRTACGLRDGTAHLAAAGARVVGISPASPARHAQVKKDHRFPFVQLSDRDRRVADRYGVRPVFSFIPGRATFVLDAEGTVVFAERRPLSARRHVRGAMDAVKQLQARPGDPGGATRAQA